MNVNNSISNKLKFLKTETEEGGKNIMRSDVLWYLFSGHIVFL